MTAAPPGHHDSVRLLRTALDRLYLWSAYLGAAFIVGIGALIAAQVVGREFGTQVRGADDLTAWSVVAAGFLPLAHTYRKNEQIRVTLLVERFEGAARRAAEFVAMALAVFFVGYLCYSASDMVWDSFRFKDLSHGLIVIPIWIPQVSVAVGTLILLIAVLDDIVCAMFGHEPSYLKSARENAEQFPALKDRPSPD